MKTASEYVREFPPAYDDEGGPTECKQVDAEDIAAIQIDAFRAGYEAAAADVVKDLDRLINRDLIEKPKQETKT